MAKAFKDLPYDETHKLRVEGELIKKQTTNKPPTWFRDFEKRIDKRFDKQEQFNDEITKRFDKQEQFNNEQKQFNNKQEQFNNKVIERLDNLEKDVRIIKSLPTIQKELKE